MRGSNRSSHFFLSRVMSVHTSSPNTHTHTHTHTSAYSGPIYTMYVTYMHMIVKDYIYIYTHASVHCTCHTHTHTHTHTHSLTSLKLFHHNGTSGVGHVKGGILGWVSGGDDGH